MTVVDSLPNRPLSRSEVDSLGEHEKVDGIFPIYGEREEFWDTAFGFVIKLGTEAIALAYRDEQWNRLETREVGDGPGGMPFDDMDALEALQDEITTYIDAAAE
jgi:hypothetical protein